MPVPGTSIDTADTVDRRYATYIAARDTKEVAAALASLMAWYQDEAIRSPSAACVAFISPYPITT